MPTVNAQTFGLPNLIQESTALAEEYTRLLRKYPKSAMLARVFAKTWHPPPRKKGRVPRDIAAGIAWLNRLRNYLRKLQEYFLYELAEPERLSQFLMIEWAGSVGYTDYECANPQVCLRCLNSIRNCWTCN